MSFPHVSSEGGPVIVGDFEALRLWRGVYRDSGDYERACKAIEATEDLGVCQLQVGDHQALVWDIGGPGVADIVQVSPSHISIVRIWPDASWSDADCDDAVAAAAVNRFGSGELAQVVVHSGYLLALWAPEDMTACSSPMGESGVPEDLSIGDGGAYIRVPLGRYSVTACGWEAVTKMDLRLIP